MSSVSEKSLPLGDPPFLEHPTPNAVTEIAQRLVRFPFAPPDVTLKEENALSASKDWFTKHDKNAIDQLDSLDFHASSGPQSVGVVPKLHNTSAGVEIYQVPSTTSKETFEKTEGPYRPGTTKKYSNKRSGKKGCQVQGGYHGRVRLGLLSRVSTPGPSCRGPPGNLQDDGYPGVPESW